MAITIERRIRRLRVRLDELRSWLVRDYIDVPGWHVGETEIEIGQSWPLREGVVAFGRGDVAVPAAWPVDETRLDLNLGGEGLLCIRYGGGSSEPFGLDVNHGRFPLRERSFSLEADVVARRPFGAPVRNPILERSQLVWIDIALERLIRQIYLVAETAGVLESHDVADPLVTTAETALASLQWPSGTHAYISRRQSTFQLQQVWQLPTDLDDHPADLNDDERASVAAASERLQRDLDSLRERYPRSGSIALTGHAHLDLAWLWPLEETRRKARRTLSTALAVMDRYPELRFNQSTAQLYAFLEEDDPALLERIRERVAAGQWETIGGTWVEMDTNMPSGESLVRQLLYGQRYFQRVFGVTHTVCWLPDCFGFTPALPQLLRGAGIENFFTIKLTWSDMNVFPYDLFWWEGLDGSRVLAHMFNNPSHQDSDTSGYNGDTGPYALMHVWRNFRGKNLSPESLLSVGYGDGGGGITVEMVERVREVAHFPALPEARFERVQAFYERMREAIAGHEVPVWRGEMYLELHRGTFTTQGRTKYLHRHAERDLVAAEVVAAIRTLLGDDEPVSMETEWRILLRNEFHDILPGSSIREVYEQAEAELGGVSAAATRAIETHLGAIAQRVCRYGHEPALLAVNPDLSPRPFRVTLAGAFPGAQAVEGGSIVTADVTVPGLGWSIVTRPTPPTGLSISRNHLENAYLRVTFNEDGTLRSVFDKRTGREALSGRGNQLWAYVDKPVSWDAWDIDILYTWAGEEITAVESMEVIEEGPHRAAVRIVRRFRSSTITQDIRLWANSSRLEFKTTFDWHDRRWLVKARFPVAVRSDTATFETAFGVVERTTHRNTTWDEARFEVAAHRFIDLSQPGFGVALLNDGRYGHHVLENELGISLLRSPVYPDPLADEGIQSVTYALMPHAGELFESGVLMEAEDLNRPLLARVTQADGDTTGRALHFDGLLLGLGTLKVAEDGGGLVLRAYEPQGASGRASIDLPAGWSVSSEIDLLERDRGEPDFDFRPFQVRSWLLRPSP